MAKKKKKKNTVQNKRQVFLAIIGLLILCVGLYSAITLRDYRITMDGARPTLESKFPVPMCSNFSLNNQVPGKLAIKAGPVAGAEVYEFRVSRFGNMFFSHTYKTANGIKEIGMMSGGKTYYVQARAYKTNPKGRSVHGKWSATKSTTIKKKGYSF